MLLTLKVSERQFTLYLNCNPTQVKIEIIDNTLHIKQLAGLLGPVTRLCEVTYITPPRIIKIDP